MVGGSTPFEGYLLVNVRGSWGAVCSTSLAPFNWDQRYTNAQVACRHLGLPWSGAYPWYDSSFYTGNSSGPGTGGSYPFVISGMECSGTEAQLTDCPLYLGVPQALSCRFSDAGEWV